MRSVFFTFFWVSIVFCLPTGLVAQKQLVGKITEAGSQLPVAGVTVYINNSQYVTRSADNGLFILKGNIPATGELVLTHISYQKKNLSFTLSHDTIYLQLNASALLMEKVTVSTRQKDTWKKWKETFIRYFIGVGQAADKCRIIDPEKLRFHYYENEKYLEAWSSTTFTVENKALGYLVHIDLDTFRYFFSQSAFVYHISKFYEPVQTNYQAPTMKVEL